MTKSQRLKPVREIASSKENEAARQMGEQQRFLEEQKERLVELNNYRTEYSNKMMSAGSSGIGAGQMQDYSKFINRLDEAMAFQRQQIAMAERALEVRQREWRAMHTRSQALDKVVNRYEKAEHHERERQEQRESDEHSQRLRRLLHDL